MPEPRPVTGLQHRPDNISCLLPEDEIRKLDRDLRILIASNGTLTRILGIVADDEIIVRIIDQQVHQTPGGRRLQRRILLKGRSSGCAFVAAESVVAVDMLPPAIMATLTQTRQPIGEVMAGSCLETFKEPAEVWIGPPPDWLPDRQDAEARIVARRYRVIAGGEPAMIITEYFLRNDFQRCSPP